MEFVLDSGADSVVLPREIVLTLIRAGTLQQSDLIAPTTIEVASGGEFQSVAFRIRELQVGRHMIRDVTGVVSPTGASPLLGGSFLSRFASWSIDNQRNALILSP
jgi:clan AA aspartic protease (TIGR02281 family)